MIKLYTKHFDKSQIPKFIDWNDSYFDRWTSKRHLNDEEKRIMKLIDNASLIDGEFYTMQTPYGKADIENLSTGCKTFINTINCDEPDGTIINISECSHEVIDEIFDYVETHNLDRGFYISHGEVALCRDREYLVNNQIKSNSSFGLLEYIL